MAEYNKIIVDATTPIVKGEYTVLTSIDGTYQFATYHPARDWTFLNTRIPSDKIPVKFNWYEYELYFTAEGARKVKQIINTSRVGRVVNPHIKTKIPRFDLISLTKKKS